ncbi:MAG: PilZ domain-containing protein [Methylococcales bacterium]
MERRLSVRKPTIVTVYMRLPSNPKHLCKATDLSSRGVFIETDMVSFPLSKPIPLFFALEKDAGKLIRLHHIRARIVRITSNGIGLKFCNTRLPSSINRDAPQVKLPEKQDEPSRFS